MSKISIVLAEDMELFRQGLAALLGQMPELTVAGIAANGEQLLQLLENVAADVVITDIQMPVMDGIAATRAIKERYPLLPVVALTMYEDEHYIVDMLEAGANGYVLKQMPTKELLAAIQTVHEGKTYFCSTTSGRLSRMIAASKARLFNGIKPADLSYAETEIIKLICQEQSSKEIAPQLHFTKRTVDQYRHYLLEKLGVKSTVGIVIFAIKYGLHTIE